MTKAKAKIEFAPFAAADNLDVGGQGCKWIEDAL
jgi:hypothetical protein